MKKCYKPRLTIE